MNYLRRLALITFTCIAFGKPISAAEWTLKGSLGQQLQYNDNISLSTIRKNSVVGYLFTPGAQATRKSEALDISFDGQGDIRRYNDSRWNCDNYSLNSNNAYRTKSNIFSLSGGYGVSCSYSQQITDTGLLLPNSQSENYRLAPSWAWQWTPLDRLLLDASYSKTSYSNPLSNIVSNNGNSSLSFTGNDTYSVSLGDSHVWSKRLSLNGKLYFSNTQYTGQNALTQKLYGLQLGSIYSVNHLWTINTSAGPRWVDTQQSSNVATIEQNPSLSLGYVADISLSYASRLSQFSSGFSNSVNPSSIGQTLQTQSVFANYSYHLADHILLDMTSNFTHSQSIGGQSTVNSFSQFNRSYFTASPAISWEVTKNWNLKGSYIYRWQEYKQDKNVPNLYTGTVDSNILMLSLGYSWDGIRSSR
jgi:hypothetical protein